MRYTTKRVPARIALVFLLGMAVAAGEQDIEIPIVIQVPAVDDLNSSPRRNV